MKKLVCLIALLSLVCACDKKQGTQPAEEAKPAEMAQPAEAAKPAVDDGYVDIPNINGLRAKVPESAKPNGVGGAAGFHSQDNSFGFQVMEVSANDQGRTFDQAKKDIEEVLFKKWIKAETTADGWILTHEMPKLDLSGDEPKEVGTTYGFEVRTKVGDKLYKCYGGIDKADGLDAVVKTCTTLKAG